MFWNQRSTKCLLLFLLWINVKKHTCMQINKIHILPFTPWRNVALNMCPDSERTTWTSLTEVHQWIWFSVGKHFSFSSTLTHGSIHPQIYSGGACDFTVGLFCCGVESLCACCFCVIKEEKRLQKQERSQINVWLMCIRFQLFWSFKRASPSVSPPLCHSSLRNIITGHSFKAKEIYYCNEARDQWTYIFQPISIVRKKDSDILCCSHINLLN